MAYLKVTEWDNCLSEASISFMPKQLWSLFVTILIFGQPTKPLALWEKYKGVMAGDISQNFPLAHTMCNVDKQKSVMNKVLLCLQEELEGMGSSLEVFGLPSPTWNSVCRGYQKQYQKKCSVLKTKQILAEENVNS